MTRPSVSHMVGRAGWMLLLLGLLLLLGSNGLWYLLGDGAREVALMGGAIALLAGGVVLLGWSLFLIASGQMTLRPWDAAKHALGMFCVMMLFSVAGAALFSTPEGGWGEIIFRSAVMAVVLGLSVTAYRKPA